MAIQKKNEIRCNACNKLLATGVINDGKIELKCKCKTVNTIEVIPPPVPYQDRMGLVKKQHNDLSFEIKQVPERH